MLADDSTFVRKKIIEVIKKDSDIELLDYAINGIEAVGMADFYKPDVLLLDLIMPEMNGLNAFEKIMNNYPIPTIILSALNPKDMDISVQALLIGAFDYIIKPKSMDSDSFTQFSEELILKIKAAYDSSIGSSSKAKDQSAFERQQSFRQNMVNKTFKFGRYINELKPIGEKEEIKKRTESVSVKPNFKKQEHPKRKIKEFKQDQIKSTRKKKVKKQIKKKSKKLEKEEKSNVDEKKKQKSLLKTEPVHNREIHLKKINKQINKSKSKILEPKISSKLKKKKEFKSKNFTDLTPIKNVKITSRIIVIGASVGGPKAIRIILQDLPSKIQSSILIVQHIKKNFTRSFVNNLNQSCNIRVKLAENGEVIKNGQVYISPGAKHMEVSFRDRFPIIKTYSGKSVNFCIPSIDVLFISAARVFKDATLGILLTGMGVDGVNGLKAIHTFGGKTIAESEETSVLFGMPKVAIKHGLADKVLPNYKISEYITHFSKSN